jgi:hypothetical protein
MREFRQTHPNHQIQRPARIKVLALCSSLFLSVAPLPFVPLLRQDRLLSLDLESAHPQRSGLQGRLAPIRAGVGMGVDVGSLTGEGRTRGGGRGRLGEMGGGRGQGHRMVQGGLGEGIEEAVKKCVNVSRSNLRGNEQVGKVREGKDEPGGRSRCETRPLFRRL